MGWFLSLKKHVIVLMTLGVLAVGCSSQEETHPAATEGTQSTTTTTTTQESQPTTSHEMLSTTTSENSTATSTSTQGQASSSESQQSAQIEADEAVLGGSVEAFQEKFGETGESSDIVHQFQNGFVQLMVADGRVFNITLSFESTGRIVSETEAFEEAKAYLPKDAKQVKSANQDGKKIYWFKSSLLKQKTGEENAMIILKYDDRGVYAAIIAKGDNP